MWNKVDICFGVLVVVQWKSIWPGTMRLQVRFLASLSGLRICCCHELWWLWARLRSCVAVAVVQVSSCRSDSTPILGTSICHECGPKKAKKKKKEEEKKLVYALLGILWHCLCFSFSFPAYDCSCHSCRRHHYKLPVCPETSNSLNLASLSSIILTSSSHLIISSLSQGPWLSSLISLR